MTFAAMREKSNDSLFPKLVRQVSDRYAAESITASQFARRKLRFDPVFEQVLAGGLLPSGGTLIDIGCGQGLMLALLVEASDSGRAVPQFDRLVGVELRPRIARIARAALGARAEILHADGRELKLERCSAVLLFDVLQMMSREEQENLLSTISAALEPNGVILIREADASAGWRFNLVRIGNRIKALCVGPWRQRFHFRSRDEWLNCFSRLGLEGELCPNRGKNPLGNVLFRVRTRIYSPR